ncbi:MAG: thiosulfate oxidation carrier protein SoxY [Gammaproteobacteria bacterium]|nr:thiosulfate oxidation carrier protein SoxY [Gammaproteobacteria bacterium]HXK55621.1 thiosulfate oxidation carrier protein SoxY [Gammaproteobacteria bacterium]
MKRRSFLKGALSITAGIGLLRSPGSLAAPGPADAFAARSEESVLRILFGDARAIAGEAVRIVAPIQATRGKGTPFKVICDLNGVEMIAVVTGNNRFPLNTYVSLSGAEGYYSTRIRVERSSTVTAYVKAGGDLYSASTHIKVNRGGYGMHFE